MHLQIKLMCFSKLLLWIVNIVQFQSPSCMDWFLFSFSLFRFVCVMHRYSVQWQYKVEKKNYSHFVSRVRIGVFDKTNTELEGEREREMRLLSNKLSNEIPRLHHTRKYRISNLYVWILFLVRLMALVHQVDCNSNFSTTFFSDSPFWLWFHSAHRKYQ